jgi:hypothetical protein
MEAVALMFPSLVSLATVCLDPNNPKDWKEL